METNPPLRAPSHRPTARQFVRVYPTYPDISTSRPGVARVANHPATFLTFLIPIFSSRSLTCISSFLSSTLPSFFPPLIILAFLAFSFRIFFHISYFTFSLLFFFLSSFFLISFFAFSLSCLYLVRSFWSHFSRLNSTLFHVSCRSLAKL